MPKRAPPSTQALLWVESDDDMHRSALAGGCTTIPVYPAYTLSKAHVFGVKFSFTMY